MQHAKFAFTEPAQSKIFSKYWTRREKMVGELITRLRDDHLGGWGNIHHLHGASLQSSPPNAAYMDVSVSRHPRSCKFPAPASPIPGSQKTKSKEKWPD
jgi:hypothetical protein